MLASLRQRRFLGMLGVGIVVAVVCCAAGTWQIFRFNEKRDANNLLRSNDRHTAVPIAQAMGPVSQQKATATELKFQHITVTGTYDAAEQTLWRGQTINNDIGYVILTPLTTSAGTLLIARGFVLQNNAANTSPSVPAPPTGPVTVEARIETASTATDKYASLPHGQVDTVNIAEQSQRLGAAMWNAYAELIPGQPGTANLTAIPDPDLSNPAGGAEEPQHAAYVVQWYIFAILAVIAPFVMAGMERRRDEEDAARRLPPPGPALPRTTPTGPREAEPEPTGRLGRRRKPKPEGSLDDRLAGRI